MTTALDSSLFEFFEFWIWTNHNSLLSIATNQLASFVIDTRSRQCYFRVCQSGEISNKRAFFSCIFIYQWHTRLRLVCHFFVLTTFWRHLWSITEQTHGNMESICEIVFCLYNDLKVKFLKSACAIAKHLPFYVPLGRNYWYTLIYIFRCNSYLKLNRVDERDLSRMV